MAAIPYRSLLATDTVTREDFLQRNQLTLPLRHGYRLLHPSDRWALLGDSLVRQQRPEAALVAFEMALALDPANENVLNAVLAILSGLKRPRAALALLNEMPEIAARAAARAALLLGIGDTQGALQACDDCLALAAGHAAARMNRGVALRALGRLADALDNDRVLVRDHPDMPDAHANFADALLANRQPEVALAAFEHCLRLAPDHHSSLMGKAVALAIIGRLAEAESAFEDARRRNPEASDAFLRRAGVSSTHGTMTWNAWAIYCGSMAQEQVECNWQRRQQLEAALAHFPDGIELDHGLAYNCLMLDIGHDTVARVATSRAMTAERLARSWQPLSTPQSKAKRQRLRIGFLSPDFRAHAVVDSHWRQLQLHDRSRFEVFAYSLRDEGPSGQRMKVMEASDHFFELSRLPHESVAARIAADDIDILIDLSGYTDHTRPELLAARVAPVQVQYVGTPGPSGASFIDYRITDAIVTPPEDERLWEEQLVWLPQTCWMVDDTVLPQGECSRRECGLPEEATVFACFNTHHKLEPASFAIWMNLLRQLPGSVLWLMDGSPTVRANLVREAEAAGVAATRLVFAPRWPLPRHLARHACADLFLDTFHYTAHNTAVNAMRAGLPLLTCRGRTMASRIAASIVTAAGLPELVAESPAHYEAMALELASDVSRLLTLKQRMRDNVLSSPLYAVEQRVRHIEQAYEIMWSRYQAGLPPASFSLPA